jgi:hypothetical protein
VLHKQAEASALPELSAWEQVLSQLEAELEAGVRFEESAGAGGGRSDEGSWTAPEGLGPLPAALGDRARRLLTAYQSMTRSLEQAQRTVLQHLTAVRAVPGQQSDRSVYLDVRG